MKYDDTYAVKIQSFIKKLENVIEDCPKGEEKVINGMQEVLRMAELFSFKDARLEVYNLNYFFKKVDESIAAGIIDKYVACQFNMKQFALVNNQVGRENGTKLLNRYLVELQNRIGEKGCVCRMYGDNFTMLFEREKLSVVTEYLSGRVMEIAARGLERIALSAYAGYYAVSDNCISAVDIMDRIGMALNVAKHVKKVPYVFFSDEIMKSMDDAKQVESLFWDAIEKEEFLVYYQPKVMTKNYQLVGAEALCRWKHDGELIPPFRFIPVLEQSNLICTLDFYMLEHVCRDISRWLKAGKPVVRVSVNMSRVHLGDEDLLEHVLEIVDKYKVPHEYIEIELTETTTDVDYRELKYIVAGLRNQGISVAVDDFGVGYSSLNLIREMPWKVLKIDRTFLPTGNEEDDEEMQKRIMLKHIIAMAQNLGLECIAEGVETVEQVTLLKENNCYLVQGYLFDRPLPMEEFEVRLEGLLT